MDQTHLTPKLYWHTATWFGPLNRRDGNIEMFLISSTEDLKIARTAKPGFPIVLNEDMTSCYEANEFLRYYLMRGDIGSEKSWEPAGQAIYDFFGFLEAHDLAWDDVSRGEGKNLIGAYRDYCFKEAGLARNTVRLRILFVNKFYEYALDEGWIKKLPFSYESRRVLAKPSGLLAHLDTSGGIRTTTSSMPRRHKGETKFLSGDQVKALLAAATNPHHRMIIQLALRSGLRRAELATFPLRYILDPKAAGIQRRNIEILIDPYDGSGMKTKGSVPRKIWIGTRLMNELHHYVVHWRGERASLSREEQKPLFLNQDGAPWANDGKGLEDMVRTIGQKAKITTNPHMLRHTYATHTLVALQRNRRNNGIEPVAFLKKQLGHTSIETTMKYVHLANELVDDAVLAYADELDALCDEMI